MNISHIESRPSKRSHSEYDFFVDCENLQGPKLQKFADDLRNQAPPLEVLPEEERGGGGRGRGGGGGGGGGGTFGD